ncbi:CaiB/BaiF CoA transferase family protein [Hydrogenophaga sp. OTU3427]|jgi:crotonobetainyl-CoA:carnitine CoA-transferase CaiB-like acyl-CoA transferase|uniref:CaiB/BaiF CoA transferase family protein n=1 Tax=Hydrogenophaga sp. OTU3427 TaxID=3043856 RepID=UPI00313BB0E0
MAGVLDGIRVLDLTRVVAGPWCTQTLADLGAEVIKIEKPEGGDDTRRVGPFVGPASRGDSAFFMGTNRGKQSMAVDISHPDGQALMHELVAQCDVVVENFKVGDLKRYGLDHATLCARHPGLIYCSVTGFGQDGPYASRPAYDSVLQAMCGLMSTCGQPDDQPGGGPMRAGVPVADIFTGLYAAIAILAALMHRRSSGAGQFIDMAMVDATTAIMGHLALGYLMTGEVPQRQGNNNPITAPSEVFRASDGFFSMSAGNNGQFAALLEVLELPVELLTDPRFATNIDRLAHRQALHEHLEAVTLTRPVAEWIDRLSARTVPCAAINDMRQVFEDPQVRHRDLHLSLPHGSGQEVPTLRSPLRLPQAPVAYVAPPMLGQHTAQVLHNLLGKSATQVQALQQRGAVRVLP